VSKANAGWGSSGGGRAPAIMPKVLCTQATTSSGLLAPGGKRGGAMEAKPGDAAPCTLCVPGPWQHLHPSSSWLLHLDSHNSLSIKQWAKQGQGPQGLLQGWSHLHTHPDIHPEAMTHRDAALAGPAIDAHHRIVQCVQAICQGGAHLAPERKLSARVGNHGLVAGVHLQERAGAQKWDRPCLLPIK